MVWSFIIICESLTYIKLQFNHMAYNWVVLAPVLPCGKAVKSEECVWWNIDIKVVIRNSVNCVQCSKGVKSSKILSDFCWLYWAHHHIMFLKEQLECKEWSPDFIETKYANSSKNAFTERDFISNKQNRYGVILWCLSGSYADDSRICLL